MIRGHNAAILMARLKAGLDFMKLPATEDVSEQLLQFILLLSKWNSAYNLTAVKEPLDMVERHLLDSLSVLDYLQGRYILDLGTGPGLPGIPLALMRPQSQFVLLDSNNKKIRFVRQVMLELGINNVQPIHGRVENYAPERPFDTIVSRAFTALPRMLELIAGLWMPNSRLLAMKGSIPHKEIEQLPINLQVRIIALEVPFSEAERHLIEITNHA